MSDTSYIHLPNEILCDIFAELHPTRDGSSTARHTLASLSRASKRYHSLANNILYDYVVIDSIITLRLLLRTIISLPELATITRTIQTSNFNCYDGLGIPRPNLSKDQYRLYLQGIDPRQQYLGTDDVDVPLKIKQWTSDLSRGLDDAELSLLLLLCPSLEQLDFVHRGCTGEHILVHRGDSLDQLSTPALSDFPHTG